MSKGNNKPTTGRLEFINSEAVEGFSSKAVADNDANPSIIVRELIQNSLDAGRQRGREKTEVVFRLERVELNKIPGLKEYRRAFEAAQVEHGEKAGRPERAEMERISAILEQSHIPALHIFDNGVGFNQNGMSSILADGATGKKSNTTGYVGSYGLGHFTTFPASDMHYVLYGGVTKDGERTMSAHAILASHEMKGEDKSKDGYYITGRKERRTRRESRYDFPSNDCVPPYTQALLDRIDSEHGSGSVVSIMAFNNFRDESGDERAVQTIVKAAAKHFFPAIYQERLEIRVEQEGNSRPLDPETLDSVLRDRDMQKERRAAKNDLINGSKAYAAYRTLVEGDYKSVSTKFGDIDLYFRTADTDEMTRISLFRSGMFICDDVNIPRNNRSIYQSYRPFNAVILVNSPRNKEEKNEAFNLIHGAEGEKHSTIIRERLQKDQRDDFDELFSEIQSAIKGMATEDISEQYSPDNFMLLDRSQDSESARDRKKLRGATPQMSLSYSQVSEHMSDHSNPDGILDSQSSGPSRKKRGPKPNPTSPAPSFQSSGKRKSARVMARRRENKLRLVLFPEENIDNAGLRLTHDRGSDPSCSKPLPDKYIALKSDATIVGKRVSDESYQQKNGSIYEIVLGPLAQKRHEVEVSFDEEVPRNAFIKVDLVSRQSEKSGE